MLGVISGAADVPERPPFIEPMIFVNPTVIEYAVAARSAKSYNWVNGVIPGPQMNVSTSSIAALRQLSSDLFVPHTALLNIFPPATIVAAPFIVRKPAATAPKPVHPTVIPNVIPAIVCVNPLITVSRPWANLGSSPVVSVRLTGLL